MAEIKEKHPTWFKLKTERRQLLKTIDPKTAVNVFLACFDYLETQEIPEYLDSMERIAFSAFFSDLEEAWNKYEKRVASGANGGRPSSE